MYVIPRHQSVSGNSTAPVCTGTRAFIAGICPSLALLPKGCGRRGPPRLFSRWRCSLRGRPTGLVALAQLLRHHLGCRAAWFTHLCQFLAGDLHKAELTRPRVKMRPHQEYLVHKHLRNSAPIWESFVNCP